MLWPAAVLLRLVLWALAVLLLPTQQVYGGPSGSSYLWLGLFGVDRCGAGSVPGFRVCSRVQHLFCLHC